MWGQTPSKLEQFSEASKATWLGDLVVLVLFLLVVLSMAGKASPYIPGIAEQDVPPWQGCNSEMLFSRHSKC